MRNEFIESIRSHQAAFTLGLDDEQISLVADYYDVVRMHNANLNLVAPTTPAEFATRHVLESLTMLEHLPRAATVADVGTGAGLPSIPCVLVRPGLRATLIETKIKKVNFLGSAIETLGLAGRVNIINRQFEETDAGECDFVTCRALDKFAEKLPKLIRWSGPRPMLLFGGNNLSDALQAQRVPFVQQLMPFSEQRYLFITKKRSA